MRSEIRAAFSMLSRREISSFGFSGRGTDRNIVSSLLIRSQLVGGAPSLLKPLMFAE